MATVTTEQVHKGTVILHNNAPWVVTSTQFFNPGKGQALYRYRIKNLQTGQTLEQTYKSGEKLEATEVQHRKAQFLYTSGEQYTFMDLESYEQFELGKDIIGDDKGYLKEGLECHLLFFQENPVALRLPPKVALKVVSTPPGVKGDTASGGTKPAELETGITIQVPLYINEEEAVRVNTETGEFSERASEK